MGEDKAGLYTLRLNQPTPVIRYSGSSMIQDADKFGDCGESIAFSGCVTEAL